MPGIAAFFASPLFHSGRQPPNSRSESKVTAKATINSMNQALFAPESHFGEEQLYREVSKKPNVCPPARRAGREPGPDPRQPHRLLKGDVI